MKNTHRIFNALLRPLELTSFITALLLGSMPMAHGNVYKNRITPQWSADDTHFWYRNDLAKGEREFVLVDLKKGLRERAFDHQRLAKALADADGGAFQAENLPLDDLKFDLAKKVVTFRAKGSYFRCPLQTYQLTKLEKPPENIRDAPKKPKGKSEPKPYRASRNTSPNGKWRASIQNHNLFVKAIEGDETIQLTKDGAAGNSYQEPYWAPTSNNLVAFRVQPGEVREVHLIESSPKEGGRAKLHTRKYPLPGDKFPTHELNWFDLAKRVQQKPEVGLIDFRGPNLRWTPDGRHLRYEKIDRGHQRFRIIEIDTLTGKSRNIIDEVSKTFIWTEHAQPTGVPRVNWLKGNKEIVYLSEQDGWRHLYLVDIASGTSKQITKGEFVVRYVDQIDEENRQIWFRGSGRIKGQDPYLIHYYRINFDGSGFTALTEGNGYHKIHYSPDHRFIIDSYSRIDLPPVHELRRVADGRLVCKLEETDLAELKATGWESPEVFSALGRDGKTRIWGLISRPHDFDPNKKYPVLEAIYAGPHDSYVPKQWSAGNRYSSWTEMGFVVVKIDGMGTANRSKAFHDVCWQNLKDAGFPDRILWHQAVAEKHSWYDISRVGIYGGSAGGQSSTGALLFHPDFYKVAVSSCGCHDNRMDKASWNEQWMGYPVGPHYAASSNIDNAHRLRGKLLLIVGELDNNVPPESTLRLAAALNKANRDYDLIVVPGAGHGGGGRHGDRRRKDFFREHLLGITPPNHNAAQ
ncbi:MAG: prolyl oligopeptidase family serine peptidase [Roseibacillus sp.]|nr:prolyl oligopeptidase family serine peptidase [Roseibacillus sp.]